MIFVFPHTFDFGRGLGLAIKAPKKYPEGVEEVLVHQGHGNIPDRQYCWGRINS